MAMAAAYYCDTSALLPRLLRRTKGGAWMRHICDPNEGNVIAIAEVTEAEIAAAINQLARGGILRKKSRDEALAIFWNQVDSEQYTIVSVTTDIVRLAARLCDTHSLKGYDAIQLACALTIREDVRLADAVNITQGISPTWRSDLSHRG